MPLFSDNQNGLLLFQFDLLRAQAGFTHGITTRYAPTLPRFTKHQLEFSQDWEISGGGKRPLFISDPDAYSLLMRQRRMEVLEALGLNAEATISNLTAGQQRHTANVACVGAEVLGAELNWKRSLPEIDGVITDQPDLPLMSIHADCIPLIFFDPVRKVTATVHSGWRGTVNKIGQVTVQKMISEYGSNPSDILAGIGPGIGFCCYEVGEPVISEVIRAFGESVAFAKNSPLLQHSDQALGKKYFDLWQANRLLLLEAGLLSDHIENSEMCTRCNQDTFFSYRAIPEEQRNAEGYGLFGSVVAILPTN